MLTTEAAKEPLSHRRRCPISSTAVSGRVTAAKGRMPRAASMNRDVVHGVRASHPLLHLSLPSHRPGGESVDALYSLADSGGGLSFRREAARMIGQRIRLISMVMLPYKAPCAAKSDPAERYGGGRARGRTWLMMLYSWLSPWRGVYLTMHTPESMI